MHTLISLILLVSAQQPAPPQPALPETDILLYEISVSEGGVRLGLGRNLTPSRGYDNQPSFSADGKRLLFSARHSGDQNDIYRIDLHSHAHNQVTRTPKNEYSPAEAPDGNSFTVVWEDSGRIQELRRYPAGGGRGQTVLKLPELIGYYAFASANVVFAFILGEPPTLQRVEIDSGARTTIASGIGRCIALAPGGFISYVRMENQQPVLHRVNTDGKEDAVLFPLLPGTEGDYAWLPDGSGVLSTQGSGLFYHGVGSGDWQLVGQVKEAGELTRLAISPDAKLLALVAAPR